jgi:hypothetical protein
MAMTSKALRQCMSVSPNRCGDARQITFLRTEGEGAQPVRFRRSADGQARLAPELRRRIVHLRLTGARFA